MPSRACLYFAMRSAARSTSPAGVVFSFVNPPAKTATSLPTAGGAAVFRDIETFLRFGVRAAARGCGRPWPQPHRIGGTIADIGELAGVVVDADPRTGAPTKFASAHDLRRAFGYRWAKRVMPAVLQKLMRHASIQTTMQYYVDLEADDVADVLWAAASNTFSNSDQKSSVDDRPQFRVNGGDYCT